MNYAHICAVLALCILGAACTTAPSSDAVAKFSTAVGTTTTSLQAGFAAVKDIEVAENEAVIERKALCRKDSHECEMITTLLPRASKLSPQLLTRQQEVLDGLKAYADKLASLRDDKTKTLVSSSVKDTGSELKSLSDELKAVTKGSFPGIDSQTVDEGVTAISSIGDWLVHEEINKDLPPIIAKNQSYIE